MGKTKEATLRFKADTTQFKAAIKDARQAISLANAEFKVATGGAKDWGSSVSGLESKLKQLNTVAANERKILDSLNDELKAAKRIYGEDAAETRKLTVSVEAQKAKIAATETSIKKYNDALDKAKTKQQQEESLLGRLNTRVRLNEEQLKDLVAEYKMAVVQYGKNSEEAKYLERQIKDLTGAISSDKKEMQKADKAADALVGSLDDVEGEARDAGEGFTVMKGAIANLVSDGINLLVRGLKDVAKATFSAGSNLEAQLAKVEAISGASAEDMDTLKEKAMEMGESTRFTATEAAEALEYMAMAGWKTENMVDGLDGIMSLAAASGTDLATTSDIITDALTAFGATAEDSGRLADIIAAASSNANTNVEMMGETFKYVAPLAGSLGYSMEDTALAISLMANAGIKSSQAGTSLRAILSNLAAPSKQAAEWMDRLHIALTDESGQMKPLEVLLKDLKDAFSGLSEAEQAAAAKAIAGKNGMSGFLAIVNGADEDFDKVAGAIANCSGTAQDMADTMNDTVDGQITLLKSKVEGIMVRIFDRSAGSMRKAIDTASKALDKVDWDAVGEKVGQFFEKLANGFDWIVDHSDTVVGALKGIGGVFLTYKTAKTVNNVANTFKDLFKLISGPGLTSLGSMSGAIAGLPFVALAGSIGAVILADEKYAKSLRDTMEAEYGFTEAQKETISKGDEMVAAWEDQRAGILELNAGISTQYDEVIPQLLDAYNDCIDKNGDVKESEKDRAEYILGELSEALGMEKEDILKLRDANGKFGESIDAVIQKQKAQMLFEANRDEYSKALETRKELAAQYAETVGVLNEKYEDVQRAEEKATAAQQAYDECVANGSQGIGVYRAELDEANEAVEFAKEKYNEAKVAVEDHGAALAEVNGYIKDNQGLSAAIIANDAEAIEEATRKVEMGFIDAESGSRQALEKQVETTRKEYENMRAACELGVEGITEDTVAEYKKRYDLSASELERYKQMNIDKTAETGDAQVEQIELNENDVYAAYKANEEAGAQGIRDGAPEVLRAESEVGGGAVNELGMLRPDFRSKGREATRAYGTGIEETADTAKESAKKPAAAAQEGIASGYTGSVSAGENFGEGYASGLSSNSVLSKVISKAKYLARLAKQSVEEEQDSHSPSKVADRLGRFFGTGYAEGIAGAKDEVGKAVKSLVGAASAGISGGFKTGDIQTSLAEAVSSVRAGVSGLDTVSAANRQTPTVQNISFVQNNTSPKALDRLSIYRETNSLLFGAKYAMGANYNV